MNNDKTDSTTQEHKTITLAELPTHLQEAVGRANWPSLMPVQAQSVPYLLERRDLMVQSRTGSGKTGGFLLPAIDRIDPAENSCQTLILTPTRELANQIAEQARTLAGDMGIRVVTVYGGVPYRQQLSAFRKGAHLVVGTPGRVLDHLGQGNLPLDKLRLLVLDEADRMLSVGFYQDMKMVLTYMPDEHVNTVMFSATFPPYVMRLANDFLDDPVTISLSSDSVHVHAISHVRYDMDHMEKDRVLVNLIEMENPQSALIFCNSRAKVNYVTEVLTRYGYDADQLSGDLAQRARERVLGRIRSGNLRLLVATDVAARGIDINELSHVFQYEVPEDPEAYVHRSGRTGRAGATGTAIILVETMDKLRMSKVMRTYGVTMETPPLPQSDEVTAVVTRRVEVALKQSKRQRSDAFNEAMMQYEPMVEQMTMDGGGIRAMAMLLDDFYQLLLRDETDKIPDALPAALDADGVQQIALSLAQSLHDKDTMRLQRIARFEAMVEQLAMTGDEFYLLTMLMADYHIGMKKQSKKGEGKKRPSKDDKPKSKRSSSKRKGKKPRS